MHDKFKHLCFKELKTPFDSSVKIQKNIGRLVTQLEYVSTIGCLIYFIQRTIYNLTFEVSKNE